MKSRKQMKEKTGNSTHKNIDSEELYVSTSTKNHLPKFFKIDNGRNDRWMSNQTDLRKYHNSSERLTDDLNINHDGHNLCKFVLLV